MKISLEDSKSLNQSSKTETVKRGNGKEELLSLRASVISEVDRLKSPPGERAMRIWNIIKSINGKLPRDKEITDWDLMCFCAEYLGSQSLAYPWLQSSIKPVLSLIYNQHYLLNEDKK